jgi:DNA repair protein RadA/Sms
MKAKTSYVCDSCGYSQVGWSGRCPDCGTWGSMVETITGDPVKKSSHRSSVKVEKLSSVGSSNLSRTITKISELDRVLGGGLVPGHVVLVAGEPGVGKSTMLLQASSNVRSCFYVAGEESATQIKIRADRFSIKGDEISIFEETDVDSVIAELSGMTSLPALVIVDSIQSLTTSDMRGVAGSVGQVRECAGRLTHWAKSKHVPLVLVGQITKGGSVAGPAALSHLVDTVLWFEGDQEKNLRILRAIKNRFGATDEIGIFRMDEEGLISVSDSSDLFMGKGGGVGSAVSCVMEGTRPIMVEIQSLVVPTKLPVPRRVASGFDTKRADVILAVLSKHARLPVYDRDVFISVAGGIAVKEPAADLALAMSIASSTLDRPTPSSSVFIGELGLMGEIRPSIRHKERINSAKRQGVKNVYSSESHSNIKELIAEIFKK